MLVALAAAASAADFSHRAHLAMKMECATCHVSVSKSTRVEDNNLPPASVCSQCHDEVAIKQPRVLPLAKFPHSKHVAAIPCLTCHKGIDKSEVTSLANFPAMSQCIACHGPGNAPADIPDSCYFCHIKTMKLTPETHGQGWVDAHSRTHRDVAEKQSCQVCHGRNFRCAGCH